MLGRWSFLPSNLLIFSPSSLGERRQRSEERRHSLPGPLGILAEANFFIAFFKFHLFHLYFCFNDSWVFCEGSFLSSFYFIIHVSQRVLATGIGVIWYYGADDCDDDSKDGWKTWVFEYGL